MPDAIAEIENCGHLGSAGECFFNGDLVILAADTGRLTVFHHEGVFAHWDLGRGASGARAQTEPGAAADGRRRVGFWEFITQ